MVDFKKVLKEREEGLQAFLKEEHPNVVEEQKHLDKGTEERAYWHYGYLMAVRDVLTLIER